MVKTSNSNFKGEGWSNSTEAENPNFSKACDTHFREWLSKNRGRSAAWDEIMAWGPTLEGLQGVKQTGILQTDFSSWEITPRLVIFLGASLKTPPKN